MASDTILFSASDGIGRIVLNRPDKLNSFNQEMKEAMRECLDTVAARDELRVLVLTGSGRAFCAGQDLGERRQRDSGEAPDLGANIRAFWKPLIEAIFDLRMPVICAVNGVAAGAGANLALACDFVLAARPARFIQSFAKIGLVPDCGGTYFLPRLIGLARARDLAMLATPLTAELAERWGLIWKCVDEGALGAETENLARHLADQPTRGLALIKRAFAQSFHNDLSQQLGLEADLQREAGQTADYREGVNAFLEKRPAKFIGR